LVIRPATQPLQGSAVLPSDKSICHRALICAALSHGTCRIQGFSLGADNVATLRALRQMGVVSRDDGEGRVQVQGVGLEGLRAPDAAIDCGNSGTTMRLLAGLLAAQPFRSRLIGDASLTRRPMGRVVQPLRKRGAQIEGTAHPTRPDQLTAPLTIGPLPTGERLGPLEYELPVASAQVKSALLLSGLLASGPTIVREPAASRDHTERMLRALSVPVESQGLEVRLEPPASADCVQPFEVALPGDLSAAAFVAVAAQIVEGSQIALRRTGLNPTRTGLVQIVQSLGGRLEAAVQGEALGEPFGELRSRACELRADSVGGDLAVRSIDEIPVIAVLAARAHGSTDFRDVRELRVKESDRIHLTVELLRAFGVEADEREDGFTVRGQPAGRVRAARVSSGGDHRIAMSAAVLGLVADGETVVEDADCIATSFPGFAPTMRSLGAEVTVE
jgi:3-phosphoshikimate 1-carboxyvinyltransferase